jgi:hypothetical protein
MVVASAVKSATAAGTVLLRVASAPTSAAASARDLTSVPHVSGTMPDIDACVARLDPQLDIGYDRIAARCPDLIKQLETGAWAPWLPRGWKEPGNDLSAGSLKEFRELVDRESGTRGTNPGAAPDVRSLRPILNALAGSRDATGWSRFKSWLRSVLERREQPTDESWFSRMVAHVGISQSVIRLITYAALAAVVVLAGIIVLNELRTAGLFGRRMGTARKRQTQSAGGGAGLSWRDIEQAPLRDRPRLLLELIVRRLSDRGALPPSGALTVRELTRAAQLPDPDDRSRLTDLALAAERARYSGAEPLATVFEEPIALGRELLERLETATAGPDAGGATGRRIGSIVDASVRR